MCLLIDLIRFVLECQYRFSAISYYVILIYQKCLNIIQRNPFIRMTPLYLNLQLKNIRIIMFNVTKHEDHCQSILSDYERSITIGVQ